MSLTEGALAQIFRGESGFNPVLQVLEICQLKAKDGRANQTQRWRLVLNDGQFAIKSAMLASQCGDLVVSGQLQQNCIVELREFLCNPVPAGGVPKKFLICLQLEVLSGPQPQIGNPKELEVVMPELFAGAAGPGFPTGGGNAGPAAQNNQNLMNNSGMSGHAAAGGGMNGGGYGRPPNQQGGGYGGGAPAAQQHNAGGYGAPQQPAYGGQPAYGAPQANSFNTNTYGSNPSAASNGSYGGNPGGGHMAYGGSGGGGPARGAGGAYGGGSRTGSTGSVPQPVYSGNRAGAVVRNEAPARIVPIMSLNPYQNAWTIKGRVSSKSEQRRWNNARGTGMLFNFDLVDDQGGEIRCTCFNDAAEKWFPVIQEGRVYMISKGTVKAKRAQFNHLSSEFEINLDARSQVEEVQDESAASIPEMVFNFKKIEALSDADAGTVVDVIGILDSVAPWSTIQRRDGTDAQKRSIVIKDDTGTSIEVTLWGQYVTNPGDRMEQEVERHPVVAIKGAKVGDFNGKTLSTISSSKVVIDPDHPEAGSLRHWFDQKGGSHLQAQSLSASAGGGMGRGDRFCTLGTIRAEQLGTVSGAAYIQVLASITHVRDTNMVYPACPLDNGGRQCKKKLVQQGDQWWCERHQAHADPAWSYSMNITLQDHTASEANVTAFSEAGEAVTRIDPRELQQLLEAGDDRFRRVIGDINFKQMLFKLKVSEETWNDEARLRVSIMNVEEIKYAQQSKVYIDLIDKLMKGEPVMQPVVRATNASNAAPNTFYGGANAGAAGMNTNAMQSVGFRGNAAGGGSQWRGNAQPATTPYGTNSAYGSGGGGGGGGYGGAQQSGGGYGGGAQQGGGGYGGGSGGYGGGNTYGGNSGGYQQQGGGGRSYGPQF